MGGRGEACADNTECTVGKCKGHRGQGMECRVKLADCKGYGTHSTKRWGCPDGGACALIGGLKWGYCTAAPTGGSTSTPSTSPTDAPSASPTSSPTESPTSIPTTTPTETAITAAPTTSPTLAPTFSPTENPTTAPSSSPTPAPTLSPTKNPTTSLVTTLINFDDVTTSIAPINNGYKGFNWGGGWYVIRLDIAPVESGFNWGTTSGQYSAQFGDGITTKVGTISSSSPFSV